MRPLLILVSLSLTACATCDHHPIACTVAGAVVIGSVAATLEAHSQSDRQGSLPLRTILPVPAHAGIQQGPAQPAGGLR